MLLDCCSLRGMPSRGLLLPCVALLSHACNMPPIGLIMLAAEPALATACKVA